jgi:integrase
MVGALAWIHAVRAIDRMRGCMSYGQREMGVTVPAAGGQKPRLLEQVRQRLRAKHYSLRTEQAYVGWIRRFILANGKRHPRELGAAEVESFLSALANEHAVAAGTQNQALAALLFLYREVLGDELPWLENLTRAKRPQRLPVVLSVEETRTLLACMDGRAWLVASLLSASCRERVGRGTSGQGDDRRHRTRLQFVRGAR